MKHIKAFDEEEQYLINAAENGQAVPVSEAEKERIVQAIHGSGNKAVSIRISQDDSDGQKTEAGIPFFTEVSEENS